MVTAQGHFWPVIPDGKVGWGYQNFVTFCGINPKFVFFPLFVQVKCCALYLLQGFCLLHNTLNVEKGVRYDRHAYIHYRRKTR